MVSMHAAVMKSQVKQTKRRLRSLSDTKRRQEEQGRLLETLLQQMDRLLRERSISRLQGRDFDQRAEN